mmetsp:Transcript_39097/g.127123  ORF Transcript_39097/g.127123 Transcript_39097/m.127123 type:complete len:324 (+) Transcript_39097:673-1644(+)
MSAKEGAMRQRIPIPEMDHGACSRDEPHPKFGPATRMHASWYCGWLRTKSSFGRAISGPIVATSTGLWYRISAKAAKPSPVLLIVLRNSFGMIRSVSTFGMFSGAAAPRTTVKRGMPPPPPPPPPPTPEEPSSLGVFTVRCTGCGALIPRGSAFAVQCLGCERAARARWRARRAILLLAVWRSFTLGPLHSFASLTNGLLQSQGLTPRDAGALVAFNKMAALLVLPPLALACAAATEPAAAASRATLMLCATTLLMATCGAVPLLLLEGGGSWAELQPGRGITLAWWVSRAATLSLAAGATAAPPAPAAHVAGAWRLGQRAGP